MHIRTGRALCGASALALTLGIITASPALAADPES